MSLESIDPSKMLSPWTAPLAMSVVPIVPSPILSLVTASGPSLLFWTEPLLIFAGVTALLARSGVLTSPSAMSLEKIVFAAYAPPVPMATKRARTAHTFEKVSMRRSMGWLASERGGVDGEKAPRALGESASLTLTITQ